MTESDYLLLVEDYDEDRMLMRRALEKAGLDGHFVIVADGQEATEYLDSRKKDSLPLPRAIVTDLHMPVVGGIELTERIRSDPDYGWIPVIILSNSKKSPDATRAYAAGANSYVQKPTSLRQCAEVMATVATFWLSVNQIAEVAR